MPFNTDRQTLDDLNIFGHQGDVPIFQLYDKTKTRGGAGILEEMFKHPLSDEEAINRRSGIFRFFDEKRQKFPFAGAVLDEMEMYLAITDERTRLSPAGVSINSKITGLIGPDREYQAIVKGVSAAAEIFRCLRAFLDSLGSVWHPYAEEAAEIYGLLDGVVFQPIGKWSGKGKIAYERVVEWDTLLRFRHRGEMMRILRYIYQLDVYIAVAEAGRERGFVYPRVLAKELHTIRLDGVYHPGLKQPVANDLSISPEGNLIFLTGANMAGKSTFMKSLGIAVFLAHMGFPVAAARMEFSVRDGLYTTINLPDNLGMGASHFYEEVLRIRKMALELSQGKKIFIVFDELFRGTNVKDAYEATVAISSAFAAKRDSMFVISTHIIEAGEELRAFDNIHFVYLPTRMEGTQPVYTYVLEQGITADRHGMIIIRNEGILDLLFKGKTFNHELHNRQTDAG